MRPRAIRSEANTKNGIASSVTTSTPPTTRCPMIRSGMNGWKMCFASTAGMPMTRKISRARDQQADGEHDQERGRSWRSSLRHGARRVDLDGETVGRRDDLHAGSAAPAGRSRPASRCRARASRYSSVGLRWPGFRDEDRDVDADLGEIGREHQAREIDDELRGALARRRHARQHHAHADVPPAFEAESRGRGRSSRPGRRGTAPRSRRASARTTARARAPRH